MNQQRFLPYARQSVTKEDIEEVARALTGDLITRGPNVHAFEEALAAFTGAKYAVCMTSATTALYAAFQAADVSAKDRFLTTPNSFIAMAAAGMRCGARPFFVDIDRSTGNMSLERLMEALDQPVSRGRHVVCPVHFSGIAVDMKRLDRLLKSPDAVVIEDAAHAIGSYYPSGEKVGSCAYSQMTVFSFHAIKTITTGEGGCVTTNDAELYHRLQRFRNSGIERPENGDPWYYEVHELAGNFHMTEMQGALGFSQLKRLEQYVQKRRQIVSWYRTHLQGMPHVRLFDAVHDAQTSYHLMVVQIDVEAIGKSRTQIMKALEKEQIGTQYHYIPIYRHPLLVKQYGEQESQFPEMEGYYAEALSLPLYVDLEEEDVKRVCVALKNLV